MARIGHFRALVRLDRTRPDLPNVWEMRVTNTATGKTISYDNGYDGPGDAGDQARDDIAAATLAAIRGWTKKSLRG